MAIFKTFLKLGFKGSPRFSLWVSGEFLTGSIRASTPGNCISKGFLSALKPQTVFLIRHVQYRSKVLVHFPRYCRGGIAVCISGLTSRKPRLTSLKTPVLPRFFAVKNTAVKNRTRWCLNSLLFPLFQRLINFNKRDVARR